MKIGATIQARLGSTRLPKKVIRKICGKSLLQWQVDRLKKSKIINEIIIVTSKKKIDDRLQNYSSKILKVKCFRGSENDVLSRVTGAIKKFNLDIHVECFGDSPLIDPNIIDKHLKYFIKKKNFDCLSSSFISSYPAGLETLIYKKKAMLKLNKLVKKKDKLREHAGYNFSRYKKLFKIKNLIAPKKYRYPNIYLEVDTHEDIQFITKIIEYFKNKKINYFNLDMILKLIKKNPSICKINKHVNRRWKKLRLGEINR